MSEQDKVIDRIKKLLRLADPKRGATPEEAAAAAAKAQELLFEHNLSMFNLGDIGKEEKPEEIEKHDMDLSNATYATVKWHRSLVHAIAKPLFCRSLSWRGKQSMCLIGKPSNVQVANYLYFYLSAQIEQMAKIHQMQWRLREMREKYSKISPNESASHKISFCLGCVMTIQQRLIEIYAQQVKANDQSHALVVVSDQALDEAFKRHFPRTGHDKCRNVHPDSLSAGIQAGKTIPIHQGVTGGQTNQKEIGYAT